MVKVKKEPKKEAKKEGKPEKKVDKKKQELVNKRLGKVKDLAVKIRDKFGKYIKSVIAFESINRPGITEDSPIEVLIVADDTAVKKHEMTPEFREILVEKVRGIGKKVDPRLKIEINMLTEFWQFVRRGDPMFFNYIRTGVPVLDLGFFEPLKRLLFMGAIKPTQEAILRSMDASKEYLKKVHTYWEWSIERMYRAVTWSCNSFFMASGMPPADPKEMASVLQHYFVDQEKMNVRYPKIIAKIVKTYKDIEHGVFGEIKGEVVRELGSETKDFVGEMTNRVKEILGSTEKTSVIKEKVKTTPKVFWVYENGSRGYSWLFDDCIIFAVYKEQGKAPPKLTIVMKAGVNKKELSKFKKVESKELFSRLETSDFKPIITPSLITVVLNHLPEEYRKGIIQLGVEYPGKALLDLSPAMIAKKGS
jgi:uncharacterized protein (UPF0332 family)